MSGFAIGMGLALALAVGSRLTRFDADRSFFPTVLIVIAGYYVLFAFMAGHGVVTEISIATAFILLALLGAYRSAIWVGVGIVLHGVYDFVHPLLITNPGVPLWWPGFCAGVDLAFGAWVIYLSISGLATNSTANQA